MTAIESAPSPAAIDIDGVVHRFGDLPTLAPVAMEVLRLADDERAGLDDIAEVISRDPGLASKLLRLANSSLYNMGSEVTSLSRAATILGLRAVKLLSLSFSLVTNVGTTEKDIVVWRRSLAGSAMARTIAAATDPQIADECFVGGLLANMGKLALASEPAYETVVADKGGWAGPDAELRAIGATSDEVTQRILDSWDLPPLFGQAVATRAHPAEIDGPAGRVARVLHVADHVASLLLSAEEFEGEALETSRTAAAEYLSMTAEAFDAVVVEGGAAVAEVAAMFDMDAIGGLNGGEILARAQQSLATASIQAVAALSEEQQRSNELADENERLTTEASTDALTELPNRRSFDAYLESEIALRLRGPRPGSLGLIMLDVDHFKAVNDTHGHQVGDDVLRGLARRLERVTRRGEMVARVGGEEFAVILPVTDGDEILIAAERLRNCIAEAPFDTAHGLLDVTVSAGAVCTTSVGADTTARLYRAADGALYAAKEGGRNRAVAAEGI